VAFRGEIDDLQHQKSYIKQILHVYDVYINPINQFNQFANSLIDLLAKIQLYELID